MMLLHVLQDCISTHFQGEHTVLNYIDFFLFFVLSAQKAHCVREGKWKKTTGVFDNNLLSDN